MRLQQKILIVDDDADIREVLNIQLTNEGYTVFESANGMEAVEAVAHNSDIDLVILDVMMPGMSGVETCTEIRKLSCVPVLFLTAKSKESDKGGADDESEIAAAPLCRISGKTGWKRFGAAGDDTDPGYPRKPGPARSGQRRAAA